MLFRVILSLLNWIEALAHREATRHQSKLEAHSEAIIAMYQQENLMCHHQERLDLLASKLTSLVR